MKLMSCALTLILAAAVGLGWDSASHAGAPCKRTTFETKLVKDACAAGGMAAAKDMMKKFVKEAKAKQPGLECATCHSKLAPSYELTPDGLAAYKKLGGR